MKLYYHICTECGNIKEDGHHPDCTTCGFDEAVCEDTETGKIDYITERELLDGVANAAKNMDTFIEEVEAEIEKFEAKIAKKD